MQEILSSPWLRDIATNLAVSAMVFAAGFLIGKYRQRALMRGRNLEQYDFYPFAVDADGFPNFSLQLFRLGVDHLLENKDQTAAAQLIVLGEQNGVRYQLDPEGLARYEKLYAKYNGREVMKDSSEFLENYRRIVRLLGGTFRGMGIEILLHDLVVPGFVEPVDGDGRLLGDGGVVCTLPGKQVRALGADYVIGPSI